MLTLWTRRKERSDFLAGKVPEGLDPELIGSIDRKGVNLYASLINTGQHDLMDSIYPGCAKLLKKAWSEVVDDYMETSPSDHYHLNSAAKGFAKYLEAHGEKHLQRFPFLAELADYEWIELEILESDEVPEFGEDVALDSPEVFQNYGPVVNRVLATRTYEYPIAKVVDWLKDDIKLPRRVKKEKTHLAIFREPEEQNSKFAELSELAALLLQRAAEQPVSYAELITFAVQSVGGDPQSVIMSFLELVEDLQELKLFLGSKRI